MSKSISKYNYLESDSDLDEDGNELEDYSDFEKDAQAKLYSARRRYDRLVEERKLKNLLKDLFD